MARSEGIWVTIAAGGVALLLAALAGCSGVPGLGRSEEKPADPNAYPTNYKATVLAYLQNNSTEMDSVREAYLSPPTLSQFVGSESRYFLCLRIENADGRKDKVIVFFGGLINQYVDATGQQCSAAAYQPFPEVTTDVARMRGKK